MQKSIGVNYMMKSEVVLNIIDEMKDEIIDLLKEVMASEPVNPLYDKTGKRSELKCSQIIQNE